MVLLDKNGVMLDEVSRLYHKSSVPWETRLKTVGATKEETLPQDCLFFML